MEPKTPTEVAERIIALLAVIGKVHQGNDPRFLNWYKNNSVEKYLSGSEKAFLQTEDPDFDLLRKFSWRAEALTSLLWSAEQLTEMPPLNSEFDIYSLETVGQIINDPNEFIKSIKLKPTEKLLEMEREMLHQHWRVRDAEIFSKKMPAELNPDIVYERRYAMSWIAGWGHDWDNVPTDT